LTKGARTRHNEQVEASQQTQSPGDDIGANADPLIGFRTDSLLFEACLGRGAMGAVYRGLQIRLDRQVAIKVISHHLAADKAYSDRFNREAKTLAKLAHPNVVTCYDFGPITGPDGRKLLVLVMEYVAGVSLTGFTQDGASVKTVLDLYRQAADGLAAAHALGVLHRDIKPDNIMVTQGGVAKLADFGLAKGLEGSVLTMTGTIMGTPAYMAPEICKGGEPVPASDVYSLGCALFDSLAGRPPFRSGSALEVIQLQISDEPPVLSDFVPQVAQLDALMAQVLTKIPEGRPSAQQMAVQLGRWRDLSSAGIKVGASGMAGQRARSDLNTMTDALASIHLIEEVVIPDAQSARSLPGSKPERVASAVAEGKPLRDVDLGLGSGTSAGPASGDVPLPARGSFQVPDYLQLQPTEQAPASMAGVAAAATPEPQLPVISSTPPAAAPVPPSTAAPAPSASASPSQAQPALRAAPPRPAVRTASDTEKGEHLHEIAVARRLAEARSLEEQGDAAAARKQSVPAMRLYNQALLLVTSGPAKATLVGKIQSQRKAQRQRQVLWCVVGAVVLLITGALVYRFLPQTADATAVPAASTAAAPVIRPDLQALISRAQDPTIDPHLLAAQFSALTPAPDLQDARVQALNKAIQASLSDYQAKLDAVVRLEHTDPGAALAMAQKLRADLKYAKWFTQLLPLPGRVAVHGVDVAQVTISDGGVSRRARDSVLFCRYADHPVTLTLSAPGFIDISQEIPADAGLGEELFSVDMQDKPLWSVDDAISDWTMLAADDDDTLILTPRALYLVAPDGAISARVSPQRLAASAKTFLPMAQPLGRPVHLSTDDGSSWELPLENHHLGRARLVRHGVAASSFCEQQLTYHVGDLGCFAIQIGEDGANQLALTSSDHALWVRPLVGKIQPWLSPLRDTVTVLDENSITVLDQEGASISALALAAPRTGPVIECSTGSGPRQIVFATTAGPHLYQAADSAWQPIPAPGLEGLGEGLLASDGQAFIGCSGQDIIGLPGATAPEAWRVTMPADHQAVLLGLDGAAALVLDDKNLLSILDPHTGQTMRTIVLSGPALCAPLIVHGQIVVASAGGISAFALQLPSAGR